jgi:hypothetical protein
MGGLTDSHRRVMKRAGLALATIGVVDIAWCGMAIVRDQDYSSSLNVFALVAGALAYRQNLGAARFIVKALSFLLSLLLLMPVVAFVLTPSRVLWLHIRRDPGSAVETAAVYAGLTALLFWIREMLARVPVHGQGEKATSLQRSVAGRLGAAMALAIVVVMLILMNGPAAKRAVREAENKAGPGYSYYVRRLSPSGSGGRAIVAAYNDIEIREIAVEWQAD